LVPSVRTLGGHPPSVFDFACASAAPRAPSLLQPCIERLSAALGAMRGCTDLARVVVSFFPKRHGDRLFPLPMVLPSPCNVALVDGDFSRWHHGDNGWNIVVVDPICWPDDPPRSAHFVKTALPLLLPKTRWVEYGDANKCVTRNKEWPSLSLVAAARPAGDVIAVRHYHDEHLGNGPTRENKPHRTVKDEFIETRMHMKIRRMQPSVFTDIDAQEAWYRAQGFEFDGFVNDAMCLAWQNTSLARQFSCVWSSEITSFSMREQLSFFHAAPAGLRVEWRTYRGSIRAKTTSEGLVLSFQKEVKRRVAKLKLFTPGLLTSRFDVLAVIEPPQKICTIELPMNSSARTLTPRQWGDVIVAYNAAEIIAEVPLRERKVNALFDPLQL